jgi:glycosyltransferase involved in cell wall biosynthesis/GR25 family glycosyltransferase involved in LPS biosynthesis
MELVGRMKTTLSKKAFELFKSGNYSEALKLYKELKIALHTNAYNYNVTLCERKLSFNRKVGNELNSVIEKDNLSVIKHRNSQNNSQKNLHKVCLIRIIGNDLPVLHSDTQGIDNLKFILENEPEFPGVDKVFLLNRIVSNIKKDELKSLLKRYGRLFFEQMFKKDEYVQIPFYEDDLPTDEHWRNKKLTKWERACWEVSRRKLRNAYLMNNNGARNYALEYGKKNGYGWILPWDGNCFVSLEQCRQLQASMDGADSDLNYLVVPMERCLENDAGLAMQTSINAIEEPQIAFRQTAQLRFDDSRVYGNQPKVELLKRLGVPGIWDEWKKAYPWKEIEVSVDKSESKKWKLSSSVFRLASGNKDAAVSSKNRSHTRTDAIREFCDVIYEYSSKALNNKSKVDYLYYRAINYEHINKPKKAKNIGEFFAQIYLVSLSHEREKRYKVASKLQQLGTKFQYVEAINGYQGEPLQWFENYKKRQIGVLKEFSDHSGYEKSRNMKLIESPGAVGYLYTYIEILKDAKSKGYESILIVEDDIVFCNSFEERFENFIESVRSDWKILLLGASQYKWDFFDIKEALKNKHYLPRLHSTKGSFAIAFNESIYDEVIEKQSYMEAPFDNLPLGVLYEKYLDQCYVVFPYLVMPDVSKSTIRETRVQNEHANRVKWWMGDFVYPQKKVNVGLLLTSSHNGKYLNSFWSDNLPFNLSVFIVTENGIVPVHKLSQIPKDYSVENVKNALNKCRLTFDLLYEVPKDVTLTEELLIGEMSVEFEGCQTYPSKLKKLEGYSEGIVAGRVSVVLPTYKRPLHLRVAAESVLNQDYEDVELLIVDDNGEYSEFDEETKRVVEEIRKSNPNKHVRYLKHKVNANGASARNTGIFASTGAFICFLDDDDVYLQGRISKSIEVLKHTNNDIGGVYCGFLGWNSPEMDPNRFASGDLTREILALDYKKHYLHTNTATYKRSAIFNIKGFDPTYRRHQDLEFNLRFFEKYRVGVVKECLVRLEPQKTSVDNKVYGMEMFNLKVKFLEDFKETLAELGESDQQEIYSKQWAEVVKYAKDKNAFFVDLRRNWDNGALQIELLCR